MNTHYHGMKSPPMERHFIAQAQRLRAGKKSYKTTTTNDTQKLVHNGTHKKIGKLIL